MAAARRCKRGEIQNCVTTYACARRVFRFKVALQFIIRTRRRRGAEFIIRSTCSTEIALQSRGIVVPKNIRHGHDLSRSLRVA